MVMKYCPPPAVACGDRRHMLIQKKKKKTLSACPGGPLAPAAGIMKFVLLVCVGTSWLSFYG